MARGWLWAGAALAAIILLVAFSSRETVAVRVPPLGDLAICIPPSPGCRQVLISLHSWSGDYRQADPLRAVIVGKGWGYIRPNLWGANDHPLACLSPEAVRALDACFEYAKTQWGVAPENIVLVGHSGGAHAALGYWHLGAHRPAAVVAWNPITSLDEWYRFVSTRPDYRKYAVSLEQVLGFRGVLNPEAARARSPLHMPVRSGDWSPLYVFAGLHDGWSGSVPVWHSLAYFNKFAQPGQSISPEKLHALVNREGLVPCGMTVEGRVIYHQASAGPLQLTVFEGGHEVLLETYVQTILSHGK